MMEDIEIFLTSFFFVQFEWTNNPLHYLYHTFYSTSPIYPILSHPIRYLFISYIHFTFSKVDMASLETGKRVGKKKGKQHLYKTKGEGGKKKKSHSPFSGEGWRNRISRVQLGYTAFQITIPC